VDRAPTIEGGNVEPRVILVQGMPVVYWVQGQTLGLFWVNDGIASQVWEVALSAGYSDDALDTLVERTVQRMLRADGGIPRSSLDLRLRR